jgi:hypothetical protein
MEANGSEKAFCMLTFHECRSVTIVQRQFRTYRAPVRCVTKTWSVVLLNKKIHILLSQVYCVWQVVKTPTIILNNPVYRCVWLKPETIVLPFKVNMVNSDIYLVFHSTNLSSQCLRSPSVKSVSVKSVSQITECQVSVCQVSVSVHRVSSQCLRSPSVKSVSVKSVSQVTECQVSICQVSVSDHRVWMVNSECENEKLIFRKESRIAQRKSCPKANVPTTIPIPNAMVSNSGPWVEKLYSVIIFTEPSSSFWAWHYLPSNTGLCSLCSIMFK